MPSSVVWSPLLLVAGLCLPVQKKWDPLYDYTHLQPPNEAFWEPVIQAQVVMEQALEVAAKTEDGPVRLMAAELKVDSEGAAWDLQIFVGGETDSPKRVDLRVSTVEPKVLKRVELLSLSEPDKAVWELLSKSPVPPEVAIQLCKDRSSGDKPEPIIDDARMRKMQFVPEPLATIWFCELMGNESRREVIRRYEFKVSATKPVVKQKLMLDRFAGEPLRAGKPTELDNGMFLYDFIAGDGEVVTADSKVKVNYRLFLLDNTKLHDTWKSKRPETFVISAAPLKGMSAGMVGMRAGGKRKIAMPYEMAFGEKGNELAPPRAMVVCDVAIEEIVSE